MNTFKILITAAAKNPNSRLWHLAQQAYINSRITWMNLEQIQRAIRESNPFFFIPKSGQ